MTTEKQFEQAARDSAGSYAIAFALLRVAEAIKDAGENIALALDGIAEARPDEELAKNKEAA